MGPQNNGFNGFVWAGTGGDRRGQAGRFSILGDAGLPCNSTIYLSIYLSIIDKYPNYIIQSANFRQFCSHCLILQKVAELRPGQRSEPHLLDDVLSQIQA